MGAYAEKICIALQEPPADAPGDSRTRLLDALGREHVRVTLSALQVLYPAIRDGRGRVTVTLSPADEGWELVRVEPGDTSQRLFALALDIGTTTLEMELLHLPDGAALCFRARAASTGSAPSETISLTAFSTRRTSRSICGICRSWCWRASAA